MPTRVEAAGPCPGFTAKPRQLGSIPLGVPAGVEVLQPVAPHPPPPFLDPCLFLGAV